MQGIRLISKFTGNRVKNERHSYWEVLYYEKGTGTLTVKGREIPFAPGMMVCIPPGYDHEESSSGGYTNYFFICDEVDNSQEEIPIFYDTPHQDLLHLLFQMYNLYFSQNPDRFQIINPLFEAFTGYLKIPRHYPSQYVETITQKMIANISNANFSLREAISRLPITAPHFRALFRQATGVSPVAFLHEKRIAYAKELLGKYYPYNLSVKEIAQMSGFSDPYYFSRLFKKQTGLAPANWAAAQQTGVI